MTTQADTKYKINDLVVYGRSGVCQVTDLTIPDFAKDNPEPILYYVLKPLHQDGFIYTPVNTKVFMRPIISEAEAHRLIDMIPSIQATVYHSSSMQELKNHYEEAFQSHNCEDLIELSMSIYTKKKYMEQQKRKFGQTDAKFMKKAEELLWSELGAALNIPREDVPAYISDRIHKDPEKQEA